MQGELANIVAALKRIPLFNNLNPSQGMALLKACERRSVEAHQVLCQHGGRSDELFILLSGQLSIRTEEDIQIARIDPIAPVGEMGIFTGEPRSATVVTSQPSTFLVLSKPQLDSLLRRNPDVELAISRNLIRLLSQRIREANRELAHISGLMADQEAGRDLPDESEESGPSGD
ncbi:MAG: cyclic nucleotide-binding domain-containing protein [Candidatus Latescibacteria bacterium]|jgi:CRP-like cAMP-binding protein|nr:cyclic nucleotide-binding domain-containing protein [Candidatus Latescibacterota bacterium]